VSESCVRMCMPVALCVVVGGGATACRVHKSEKRRLRLSVLRRETQCERVGWSTKSVSVSA